MENTSKKNYYRKSKKFYNNHNYYNKSKIISYTKKFETFEDGFSEVIKYNPELKNYCGRDPILIDVITTMLNSIKDNIPSIDNYNYPNTLSLSINAKEVGFKTDINIALGWRTGYDFNSGKSHYIFRVSFMTIPSYKKSVISDMAENGWNKISKEENKNNKLEKKKENTQKIVTIPKEKQKYVKLDQGLDVEMIDSEYEKEIEDDCINPDEIKKESNNDLNDIDIKDEQVHNDDHYEINEEIKEKVNTEKLDKIEEDQNQNNTKDSVIASPVAGTFIITHNNQTSVININEPNNNNGILIDKDNMTVTYPDGTKFNLKK